MLIITDEKLIRRNTRIARTCVISGMIVLLGGFFASIKFPEQQYLVIFALIIGFFLSQVGIFFTNRWARQPRADILLNQALKGFDDRYAIFHYSTPASHLLVGPAGIWVFLPFFQKGSISYSKGRWHQKGGNLYLKMFAQEGLGRPDLEVQNEIVTLQTYMKKNHPDIALPEIKAALVFTNKDAVIEIADDENPPAVAIQVDKLKDFLRKIAKTKPIPIDKSLEIQKIFLAEKGLEKASDNQQDAEQDERNPNNQPNNRNTD